MTGRPGEQFADPAADLGRLHVIVPLHGSAEGKVRLGLVLDAEDRGALVLGLLQRTLTAVRGLEGAYAIHVVSRDPAALGLASTLGAQPIEEEAAGHADGLNAALVRGRDAAMAAGATAVLYLPADLPLLTTDALARLIDAADAALAAGNGRSIVVAAPADARGGTNALLLSPPGVIQPAFGEASLEAHVRAAAAAGATVQLVADPELGFDLDTPEDLERLDGARLVELLDMGALAAVQTA